jgi:phosphoribosylamine--glycine ligase
MGVSWSRTQPTDRKVNVLLIGGGGREHALGWKLAQSPRLSRLVSLPGNPGLAELGPTVEGIEPTSVGAVGEAAASLGVDLVVVGPEAPLAAGLTDVLLRKGIPVWGPTRAAAQLESSKSFAKGVMDRCGVSTAAWACFDEHGEALRYLSSRPGPYVVKADGLAAGKGVLVTEDHTAAVEWVRRCLEGAFGAASVVIEDYLEGREVSVFALCAEDEAMPLEPARDYKRLLDGDRGPNTGGMGAYSPVIDTTDDLVGHTVDHVIKPVLTQMAAEGHPYSGFLYVGLVETGQGPQVLEFNCRLGDPETQVVLPRMDSDLVDLIEAGLAGKLAKADCKWNATSAVNVVLASAGYPDSPRSGASIKLPELAEDELIFHAGTAFENGRLVTAGGRVLSAVGVGPDVEQARERAYDLVNRVRFAGKQFRRDIAL